MSTTMSKSSKSSSLALAWGRQLKMHREAAGLTQEALATKVKYARSTIASLETGAFIASEDVAKALDDAVNAKGLIVMLRKDMVDIEIVPEWYRDWLQIEQQATAIRGNLLVLVPGLLQTPAYARVVFEGNEDAVAARLTHQAILDKDDPPTLRYVLDQHVLERPIGGKAVMAEQLAHLEDAVTSGRAQLFICPSGAIPSVVAPFYLANVDDQSLGYLEAETQGVVLTKRRDVLELETIYEKLLVESLPSGASLEAIRKAKQRWQS
jgi:transcriptional regulator with XRE-family HTH domain